MRERITRGASFLIWPALAFLCARYYLQVNLGGENYKTADWLINFEGGPVRRALIGQILYLMSEAGPALKWVVFGVQVATYALVFFQVHRLYLLRRRGPEWLVVFLCPAFLLFPFYDPQGGFRKEILVFVSFGGLALFYARKKLTSTVIALSLAVFLLAGFSHELTAFTLPFFAWLLFKAHRSGQISARQAAETITLFSVVALGCLIGAAMYPGTVPVQEGICASLSGRGFAPDICDGAIRWLGVGREAAFERVIEMLPLYLPVYPVLFVLAMIPLLLSSWWKDNVALLLTGFAFMLPLFVMATDWGRWIHIYVFFVFVSMLADSALQDIQIRRLPVWLACMYLTLWSIPHYQAAVTFGLPEFILKLVRHIR
ncbi:MAG: hypothetical protein ABIP38_10465 [Steroidobacteraceae bacterium]